MAPVLPPSLFPLPLPGPPPSGMAWHTRRRISSRKVRRGVSNVITLDSCLLCSSTTKSYSALTSKAKLPSGVPGCALSFPRTPPALFSPPFFLRCNDVRTKDVNKSRRKRGRQWKTSDEKRTRTRRGGGGGGQDKDKIKQGEFGVDVFVLVVVMVVGRRFLPGERKVGHLEKSP